MFGFPFSGLFAPALPTRRRFAFDLAFAWLKSLQDLPNRTANEFRDGNVSLLCHTHDNLFELRMQSDGDSSLR